MSKGLTIDRQRSGSGRCASDLLDDRRLAELDAALRVPGTSVLSLDCFDTLLWRRVPKPTDVFLILGEEMRARGQLADGISIPTFARLRVAAEAAARRTKLVESGTDEIDLGDVYRQMPSEFTSLSVEELRHTEVSLERRLTVADPLLADVLSRLVAELDLRVLVVSDMYLSGSELAHLLDRPRLAGLAGAEIITSSEAGMGKEHGLWNLLPVRLGVRPDSIVHVGNHAGADVSAPRAAGVRAVHWAERSDRLGEILGREGRIAPTDQGDGRLGPADDAGLTALRGRAAYAGASRLHQDQVAWETGTSVLGPVMAGYADWVRRRTSALGITHALCVMREGRFLKELVDVATESGPDPALRCELLWASREAIARASITKADAAELEDLLIAPRVSSLAGAARTLGIDISALPPFAQLAEQAPHLAADANVMRLFVTAVLDTPALVTQVRETAARRRANFVRHLRSALGDAAGGEVALIDVGWRATNQEKLQEIIDAEGLDVRLRGFYLMSDTCPEDRLLRNHRVEGYITRPADPAPAEIPALVRNRLILELLLLSDDGMTLEINDAGEPVCAGYRPPPRQQEQVRTIQDGIRHFQRHVVAYQTLGEVETVATVDSMVARGIIERFLCAPTFDEADAFRDWECEDEHGNVQLRPLIPTSGDRLVHRLTASQLAEQPHERVVWPAGAAALWDGAAAGLLPGPLSQGGVMRVQLDRSGNEFPATGTAPLRLGRDGASVASWSGDGTNVVRGTVFPSLTGGLLRLDGLQLVLQIPLTGWRSVLWSWSANDDPGRLRTSNCNWIAPNVLVVTAESSLHFELAAPLPSAAQVQLEMRGGFLSLTDGSIRIEANAEGAAVSFHPM